MLISLYSIGQVTGAEVWVFCAAACGLLYLGLCCLFQKNRNKRGMKRILLALLAIETVYDVVCRAILFPGGEYHNYGIGAASVVLVWPGLLLFVGLIVTGINAQE